jgi:hypothetical protein
VCVILVISVEHSVLLNVPCTICIGPYTNVLDLALFPAMSKHHSEIIQIYNNTEATKERTWTVAKQVRAKTTSSEVARAFVLAFRVTKKIIEEKGDNRWLADRTPHCNVRRDFMDTEYGIRRKDSCCAEPTSPIEASQLHYL